MHVDINSPDTGDLPGPFHESLQTLKRLRKPGMTLEERRHLPGNGALR